jgi:DNA-binding Xre family transcriptional regulator
MSASDLADYLRKRLDILKLSIKDAAQHSGISRQSWHKLLNADVDEARLSTLTKVADVLETHAVHLVRLYCYGASLPQRPSISTGLKRFDTGFIADITYPDNSLVYVGQEFEKVWELVNLGSEAWRNWRLTCIDDYLKVETLVGSHNCTQPDRQCGLMPLTVSVPIPDTLPGEHVRVAVKFRAPSLPCSVISHWKSVNAEGDFVFPALTGLWCQVKVVAL